MTDRPQWRDFAVKELQQVHCKYQRPLDPKRAQRLAKQYDPNLERPPLVSDRGTGVAVVDGQHTVEMLRILFGPAHRTTCKVVYDLSYEQEAHLYGVANSNSKHISVYDKYVGLLEEKDEEALQIQAVIDQAGFTVSHGHGSAGPGEWNKISAIGTVQRIVKVKSTDRLAETLKIIAETFAGEPAAASHQLLWAISAILDIPQTDTGRLIRILKTRVPTYFIRRGEAGGGASAQCYARIAAVYNYKMKNESRKLPPEIPSGWYGK